MASISRFLGTGAELPPPGAAGAGAGQVGNTAFRQVSPTGDPAFAELYGQTREAIPRSLPTLETLISGGMESPLLQAILGPAMERLRIPQAQQREQFTEGARAAGGLRGSTYQQNYGNLLNQQALQGNDLMSQIISQVLSTLVGGQLQEQQNSFLPARSMTDLLRTIAPSTITGPVNPSGGFGGGSGGSGAVNDPFGILSGPSGADSIWDSIMAGGFNAGRGGGMSAGGNDRGWSGPGALAGGGGATAPASQPFTPYLDPFAPMTTGPSSIGGSAPSFEDQVAAQQTYGEWQPTGWEGWY